MNAKVLVVGVDRIGCDIVKILVNSGFSDIEIIDLETSDVNSLRQQFIENGSVVKTRGDVAREEAMALNSNVQIKVTNFGHSFFQKFELILNALDNAIDRDHLNSMCLAANVHVIDCYKCAANAKIPHETLITNYDPAELIDSIVWGRKLFKLLFDESIEVVSPANEDTVIIDSVDQLALEFNEKITVNKLSIHQWARDIGYDTKTMFNKFFNDDIKNMPSNSEQLVLIPFSDEHMECLSDTLTGINRELKPWSLPECQSIFAASLTELRKHIAHAGHLMWKENDKIPLDFITACANLRAHNFQHSSECRFKIKLMLTMNAMKDRNILDFPAEVLERIFINSDDKTLLSVSRACRRFRAVAQTVMELKYSTEPYELNMDVSLDVLRMHRSILINIGHKIAALDIMDAELSNDHGWLMTLLEQNNVNLKKLGILTPTFEAVDVNLGELFEAFPNLTDLRMDGVEIQDENWGLYHTQLKSLEVHNLFDIDEDHFQQFFDNNQQIESIVWLDNEIDIILCVNDRLNNLKHLYTACFPIDDMTTITLDALESLKLSDDDFDSIHQTLEAFQKGCPNIKELSLELDNDANLDEILSTIPSFEQLKSLKIVADVITIEQLKRIDRENSNLESFTLSTEIKTEDTSENYQLMIDEILSTIASIKCLTKLELSIDMNFSKRIDSEFHARFLEAIATRLAFELVFTIEYRRYHINLTVTKDHILRNGCDSELVIVYEVN